MVQSHNHTLCFANPLPGIQIAFYAYLCNFDRLLFLVEPHRPCNSMSFAVAIPLSPQSNWGILTPIRLPKRTTEWFKKPSAVLLYSGTIERKSVCSALCRRSQRVHHIQALPGQVQIIPSKMPICRHFLINWPFQIQSANDGSGAQIKGLAHDTG